MSTERANTCGQALLQGMNGPGEHGRKIGNAGDRGRPAADPARVCGHLWTPSVSLLQFLPTYFLTFFLKLCRTGLRCTWVHAGGAGVRCGRNFTREPGMCLITQTTKPQGRKPVKYRSQATWIVSNSGSRGCRSQFRGHTSPPRISVTLTLVALSREHGLWLVRKEINVSSGNGPIYSQAPAAGRSPLGALLVDP